MNYTIYVREHKQRRYNVWIDDKKQSIMKLFLLLLIIDDDLLMCRCDMN